MGHAELLATVQANLDQHGFPTNEVSFASADLARFAHKHELSLSRMLDLLAERQIEHRFEAERVYFRAGAGYRAAPAAGADTAGGPGPHASGAERGGPDGAAPGLDAVAAGIGSLFTDVARIVGLDPADFAAQAGDPAAVQAAVADKLRTITPAQMLALQERIGRMSPEEHAQLAAMGKLFGPKP